MNHLKQQKAGISHMGKIPKIVYKIWLGNNEMPTHFEKYVDTWRSVLGPEWEIHPIGNTIVPGIADRPCVKWCCESGNYTVLNHYVRYYLLYNFGGVYMDLDVEMFRPFDFKSGLIIGMESERWINNHCIISEPGHKLMEDCMDWMDYMDFGMPEIELSTGPRLISNLIYMHTNFKYRFLDQPYLTHYKGSILTVMPERCLSGHRWYQKYDPKEVKNDTYCVHHYNHSWKK